MTSPSQRPLPDNTQHSQQTSIHAPGGIRTHNLSRRAAKDLRLRPRGHWDRHLTYWLQYQNKVIKHYIHLKYCHASSMLETRVCFHDLSFFTVGGRALSSSIKSDSSCRQFLCPVPINAIKGVFFSAQCMLIQTGAKPELHLVQGKNSPF